jgi:eukaryotic-like serine/threonine-protein kinase
VAARAEGAEGRLAAFVAELRAATIPPDALLLQQRLRTFVGFVACLWTLTFFFGFVVGIVARGVSREMFAIAMQPRGPWLHASTAIALGWMWAWLRGPQRQRRVLDAIDFFSVLLQCSVLAVYVAWDSARAQPQLPAMLAVAHVLVLRSALVPSPARRTLAIGLLGTSVLFGGTSWLHLAAPVQLAVPLPVAVPLLVIGAWSLIAVATSTLVSSVFHGLRKRADAATQVGQYTLEEKIGEGGMGAVYRARHALLRRPTAIKLLPHASTGDEALARFEREVQLTSRLSHPNIIAVYDFGRSAKGVFYYAMEYLDGVDLELLVREDGAQPPARVLGILRQAADALAEAHAVGLIHRDVKPANMILCDGPRRSDNVKLVDFGLVKNVGGGTVGSGLVSDVAVLRGTPLYMAPEAISEPEHIDGRTDLYALGAVGYFLLMGRPVFEGKTIVEVCSKHLTATVDPLGPDVPAALSAVIMRCLEKKQADRYENAAALHRALLAVDDVAAWTDEQAQSWWQEKGARLRERRSRPTTIPAAKRTFAVDRSTADTS